MTVTTKRIPTHFMEAQSHWIHVMGPASNVISSIVKFGAAYLAVYCQSSGITAEPRDRHRGCIGGERRLKDVVAAIY